MRVTTREEEALIEEGVEDSVTNMIEAFGTAKLNYSHSY